MTMTVDQRSKLIQELSREVTFSSEPPYPELEAALSSLVAAVAEGKAPGVSPDWAAIVSEAIQLRPQH